MARRYGTGTIYQRADGMWIGAAPAGVTGAGTRRRITVSASTKAEATKRLRAKQADIAKNGLPVEGVSTAMTVARWATEWLKIRTTELRPGTLTQYRSSITGHVIPAIGHRRLEALTPADLRAVSNAIADKGLTTTTARLAHHTLRKMLRDAVSEGHQVPLRVLTFKPPKAAESPRDAIPPADALAILKVAVGEPDGSRWVAALLQGMRQAERLGLTRSMVDFDKQTIDISWQLQRVTQRHTCVPAGQNPACGVAYAALCRNGSKAVIPAGYAARHVAGATYLVAPKTEKGKRIIPMVPWMSNALRTWLDRAPASPHDLVWCRDDGTPWSPKDDNAAWRSLQTRAGVTKGTDADGAPTYYVGHEARHTTATLLLEAGVDPKVVTAIMGHSTITTSRGYQHVSQALARKALEDVARTLQLGE